MPLLHKFQRYDFTEEFKTHHSILDTIPYDPEVMFIGTFNHGWSWNEADFFYGRGMYMWTILGNLFLHNKNFLIKERNVSNRIPEFNDIIEICKKGRIIFADIVKGTKPHIDIDEFEHLKLVRVNNEYEWNNYKDKSIDYMARKGWIDDNVDEIIEYINKTKSIKHIYFTFKNGSWIASKLHAIVEAIRTDVEQCSIFTPTGMGFRHKLQIPFDEKAWSIAHCWVWNGLPNSVQINKPGYGHLDHDWLLAHGVDPRNF